MTGAISLGRLRLLLNYRSLCGRRIFHMLSPQIMAGLQFNSIVGLVQVHNMITSYPMAARNIR